MRLLELREEQNLTQEDIAKAINTSRTNIGRWEKGINEPSASLIVELADFFKCSTDYLLGREDDLGVINIPLKTEKLAPALSKDEQTLLNDFRSLPVDLKRRALIYLQNLIKIGEEESLMQKIGVNKT